MTPEMAQLWGAIIVSVVVLVTFTGAMLVAYFLKDPGLLNVTVGASATNAAIAVGYWLGSSSSSRRKDDTLAAIASQQK